MSYRKDKIERMIKEELGWIFIHKLKDPALGFITITNVKVSPDLKLAKIYLSVFQKENRQRALDKVYELKGLIRSELAHKIKIRFVPDLDFYIDDTPDYVEKMENLFKKIHDQQAQSGAGDSHPGSDSSADRDTAAKDERNDD